MHAKDITFMGVYDSPIKLECAYTVTDKKPDKFEHLLSTIIRYGTLPIYLNCVCTNYGVIYLDQV